MIISTGTQAAQDLLSILSSNTAKESKGEQGKASGQFGSQMLALLLEGAEAETPSATAQPAAQGIVQLLRSHLTGAQPAAAETAEEPQAAEPKPEPVPTALLTALLQSPNTPQTPGATPDQPAEEAPAEPQASSPAGDELAQLAAAVVPASITPATPAKEETADKKKSEAVLPVPDAKAAAAPAQTAQPALTVPNTAIPQSTPEPPAAPAEQLPAPAKLTEPQAAQQNLALPETKPVAKDAAPAVSSAQTETEKTQLAFAVRLEQAGTEARSESQPNAQTAVASTPEAKPRGGTKTEAEIPEAAAPAPRIPANDAGMPAQTVPATHSEPTSAAAKATEPATVPHTEPIAKEPDVAPKAEVRDISIRIVDERARTASVRVSEVGGEVRVSVRSADPAVATSLRSDLSDLAARIEKHDVSAEIWHPEARIETRASSSGGNAAQQQKDSGEGRGAFDSTGRDGQHSRGNNSGRGNQHAPEWLDEFDSQPGTQNKRLTR